MQPSNILKIDTLNNEWRDKDSVMLHACFQLLKDFVEDEVSIGNTDWNTDEKHRGAKVEIDDLYNWWAKYSESDIPNEENPGIENDMLIRLIKVRWALWI